MRWKPVLAALVALGLAPGTFVRTAPPADDLRPILHFAALDPGAASIGSFAIEGVWHMISPNAHMGGWSGLVASGDGSLLAVSDRGRWLRFDPPGGARSPRFGVLGGEVETDKRQVDAEAAVHDRASGTTWIAYEGTNAIERYRGASLTRPDRAEPPEMARWPGNRGAEAMARLGDGRFLVLGEGSPEWTGTGYPGLLFDGDPVDGAAAEEFAFVPPEGFRATDAAALPDGRVLILLRRIDWVLPPRFTSALMVADPAEISLDGEWRGEIIATIGGDMPRDNFEGLAVVPEADGSLALWLISDDNTAALQRTLLYKLRWNPDTQKARGSTARPAMP